VTGRFVQVGKAIFGEVRLIAGSTTLRGTGTYRISLPFTGNGANYQPVGQVVMRDASAPSLFFGTAMFNNENYTRIELFIHSQTSIFDEGEGATHDQPFFFSEGDQILISFMYERT
jgi:hypothetical protein